MTLLRRLLIVLGVLLVAPLASRANQAAQGWCETGNRPVVMSGLTSTTKVQQSFPSCTVTVFIHGGGLAAIFSDNAGTPTPLANPFTAQSNGRWLFYAANGRYDIQLSGAGFPAPVVYSDISLADPANQSAAIPCTTLTFSATPSFNATNNACYQMPLNGNVTSSFITGTPANGNLLAFTLTQDATGGRTVAFPANFIIPAVFTLDTIATHPNYLMFKFDGTNWSFVTNSGTGGGGSNLLPLNNTWLGTNQFNLGIKLLGATSGTTQLSATAVAGTTTATFPANTGTVAELNLAQNFTVAQTFSATALANAFISTTANPAAAGALRLASGDSACWRNNALGGDLCLSKDTSDVLSYAGVLSATAFRTASANPSLTGVIRLASGDAIGFRNNALGADLLLSKNSSDQLVWPNALSLGSAGLLLAGSSSGAATLVSAATGGGTHSLPNNTGTVAELNLAQTWTANQSVANGTELRFFSTNATNYAGFKGGASVVNLVWLFPSTDSSGTQCLSSNGSLQLAWSACSAGTGTPGGASTNIQYNNAGAFAGSGNFTFNGTDTVGIGLLNTTLGKLQMFGNTSGSVTIQTQAVAGGTLAFTLPNASGTAQVSASAPLVASATTGNLTCPTCDNSAATLTANQLMLGGGTHATSTLGTLGTTTTVLHGNAGGAPTFAAVNLATETTGTTPIANGGTGQITASAAFNALSPITTTGDLIIGTGVNTASRLGIGGNGLCLVSNGTTAAWASCATGSVGGAATSGQGAFWNGTATIGGSVNWLYSAATGHSVIQGANNVDALYMKRFTDTAPTGNFLHFQNAAANADVFKVDVLGNATMLSATFNGVNAGGITLVQGTAPALVPNAIQLIAPTTVAASGEQFAFPGTPATGFIRWTNSAGVETGSFVSASGTGSCTNQVITQNNDNAPPTCTSVVPTMFASAAANSVLIGPNGSAGVPTFRVLLAADLPAISLTTGVSGILPIANGGTNGVTASAGFNNLSPMTTQGDIIYENGTPSATRLAAGTSSQLLHSGTTPSWGAVALATEVSGTLPVANGGTGQTTASAAFNALAPATSANGLIYATGVNAYGNLAAGGAGTLCLTETNGAAPTWGSCAGSSSTVWSALTNPGADLSLSMGVNNSLFTHGVVVGTRNAWEYVDGNSTSTGSLAFYHTGATSTMKPLTVTAQGTANGVQMDTAANLGVIGAGNITATKLSRTITATTPLTIGGGGSADLTADRTLACPTCNTSASAIGNNQLAFGSGGAQGLASSANLTTTGGSGIFSVIAGVTTAGVGVPIVMGVSNVTAQSASQGAVTVATAPTAGSYLIRYYASQNAVCTTGSNSVSFTFSWTDAGNARVLTTGPLVLGTAQLTGAYLSGLMPIFVNSGNVTYTSTVAGTCASGTSSYDIHASIERTQ